MTRFLVNKNVVTQSHRNIGELSYLRQIVQTHPRPLRLSQGSPFYTFMRRPATLRPSISTDADFQMELLVCDFTSFPSIFVLLSHAQASNAAAKYADADSQVEDLQATIHQVAESKVCMGACGRFTSWLFQFQKAHGKVR